MATLERCDSMDDLRFLDPEALNNREAFNERFELLNPILNSLKNENGEFIGARVETGSYTGTGTYGASNPNSLTFGFAPKIVFIYGRLGVDNSTQGAGFIALQNTGEYAALGRSTYGKISQWGETVSWYYEVNYANENIRPYAQMNGANQTYNYVAIG